MTIRKE